MLRFAWNKNQMIAEVTLRNFVITYVIQNMHRFCVILHGSYKIALFLFSMWQWSMHYSTGFQELFPCCKFCQMSIFIVIYSLKFPCLSLWLISCYMEICLQISIYIGQFVCLCVCLSVCVSVAKFVFAISQVSV